MFAMILTSPRTCTKSKEELAKLLDNMTMDKANRKREMEGIIYNDELKKRFLNVTEQSIAYGTFPVSLNKL